MKELVPPNSRDAGRDLLGSLILLPSAWDEVAAMIHAEDFSGEIERQVFLAMAACRQQHGTFDTRLLEEQLQGQRAADGQGWRVHIGEIVNSVPTAFNLVEYAGIVREKATLRELAYLGEELTTEACTPGTKAEDVLAMLERRTAAARDHATDLRFTDAMTVMQVANARLIELEAGAAPGIPTPFAALNEITGGLHPGELTILAARPSDGKTASALQIAAHVAQEHPVLFASMEMPAGDLGVRLLCATAQVKADVYRKGLPLTAADKRRVVEASAANARLRLFFEDRPGRTMLQIAAAARRLRRNHGQLGLVAIDYLGLVTPENKRDQRHLQVDTITLRAKELARELNVSVLLLCQLNRNATQRGEEPHLHNLRESGGIEQHADGVWCLHSPWNSLTEAERQQPENQKYCGKAVLFVRKQRNGPKGAIGLRWHDWCTRFDDLDVDEFGE